MQRLRRQDATLSALRGLTVRRNSFLSLLQEVLESFVPHSQSSNPFPALRTLRLLNVLGQSSQLGRLARTLGRLKDSECSAREVGFTRCDFGVGVDPHEVFNRVYGAGVRIMWAERPLTNCLNIVTLGREYRKK